MSSNDKAGKSSDRTSDRSKEVKAPSGSRSHSAPNCRRSISIPVPKLQTSADFETWQDAVTLWCRYNDDDPANQAIAVHLTLDGRARAISNQIPLDELCSANGVSILLKKLAEFFLPGKNQRQHLAYRRMHRLSRPSTMSMENFICDFEQEYFKHQRQGMHLPEGVVSNMLVTACNLPEDKVHMIMAGLPEDLTYDKTKAALLRVFSHGLGQGDGSSNGSNGFGRGDGSEGAVPVLYSSNARFSNRGRRKGGSWPRPSGNHNMGRNEREMGTHPYQKKNPVGRDGQIMTCRVCGSIYHWARQCPQSAGKHKRACYVCNSTFHLARNCPERGNTSPGGNIGDSSGSGM